MIIPASPARPFGIWTATALVIGGMIGAGIFVLPAQLAGFGLTGVAGWVIAIAGALVLCWVLCGLNAARPESSGLLAITGEALGPLLGLINAWAYWVTVWTTVAVLGTSAASYLAQFFPVLARTQLNLVLTAVGIVWMMTLINLAGARTAGIVQVATTVLKLLPLLVIVLILAVLAASGGGQFSVSPHPGLTGSSLPSAVNLIFFALLGFEAAGIAAERVRDPARTVPRATMIGLVIAGGLYLIVCSGVVYALPTATLAASNAPMALFVATFWGSSAGMGIAAFAAIAAIGCLNGWVLLQGEVPLGMARAGLLPRWFGEVDDRDVPRNAILLSSGLASLLLLTNISRSTADLFAFMLRVTTTTAFYTYALFCVAALVMGIRRPLAIVGLLFSVWAIFGSGFEAGALSLALMAVAVPLYWLAARAVRVEPA